MPVSHIGLTVSHLPTSCSFFLSALNPLGYRFVGQQGSQIGLGINDADFFICQETPGMKAGAAHIAFSAPSRAAVREFYAAALNAGGRPHGAPAVRHEESGYFNAAVLDFDGNSIEVVYREVPDPGDAATVVSQSKSRVLGWSKAVTESLDDQKTVVSRASTMKTATKTALVPASTAPRNAATVIAKSESPSISRSFSAPVIPAAEPRHDIGDIAAKKIIGTLIGAAAGAAVAYAMVKGEQDSSRREANAYATVQRRIETQTASPLPEPEYESPVRSQHRVLSIAESYHSTPSRAAPRAIEAPPPPAMSYHSPSYETVAPSRVPPRIEYIPASVVSARSNMSAKRSMSSPSVHTVTQTTVSQSTLIKTYVPSEAPRLLLPPEPRPNEGTVVSHRSSKSRAKSTHTSASKHSTKSKSHVSEARAPTIIGSVLGRDAKDHAHGESDSDSIAPSESISNVGSSRHSTHSRRSKSSHSHSHSGKSTTSRHSDKHSRVSRRSHREEEVIKPDAISETGSTSTVKPAKSRKDKVVSAPSAVSLPVRGITPSMIEGKKGRSIVSYAYGQ